ncbi:MAG: hypothetical protein O2888_01705 [Chloroflexi bacterium]|nr:hypothetical protein [Chloroflexota bacterium]
MDTVEYGAGSSLAAPAVGMSIHRWFDNQGRFLGTGIGSPTPGLHAPVVSPEPGPPAVASTPAGVDAEPMLDAALAEAAARPAADHLAWLLLFAVASGAVGGVLAQRIMASRQGGPRERSDSEPAGGSSERDATHW